MHYALHVPWDFGDFPGSFRAKCLQYARQASLERQKLSVSIGGIRTLPESMPTGIARRRIPSTGKSLPVIGLGTYRAFDVPIRDSELVPLETAVRSLVSRGGSLIDSSPMYGRAEAATGAVVARTGLQENLFLATKVWATGRAAGIAQMEDSMRRMGTSRMDLFQVHNLLDWRTHMATLMNWKESGRVRHIGITHYHRGAYPDVEKALTSEKWDFLQVNYSLEEAEAEERLLPLAAELGVAVIANRPFAQGALFSKVRDMTLPCWAVEYGCNSWAQVFLKWILSHQSVTCVIPASRTREHTEDNLNAGVGTLPDTSARARILSWFRSL
ncbi:MAG: aldo/keto reductase [Betaproteobacteria bacterium]